MTKVAIKSEKNFDVQNNYFGWAHLPFSFLEEDTVFMLTAMLKNFYLYLQGILTDKIKSLGKADRLKSFMLHFICAPAK